MPRNTLPANIYALALGIFGVGALIALTDSRALEANAVPLAFFAALSFILKRTGFHVAPDVTHSLVGIVDLAAVFDFGPVLGAWVGAASGFFYLFLYAWRRDKHTFRELVEIPLFNAGLKIGMAYASSHLYLTFGGQFAPRTFTFATIPPVLTAGLAWFIIDHIGWGLLELLRGGASVFDPQMRTFTFHHLHPRLFAPMGTMQAAGGARDWLLRVLGNPRDADASAAASPTGANGLIFLPYLIGERSPWWNPKARGAFVGLTISHTRAEMTRAVLEGMAVNLRMILDALESEGAVIPSIRLIGGGAQGQLWRQILADVFARPIQVLELVTEATSWGAAVAAGIGIGVYHDWNIAKEHARVKIVVEPNHANVARYVDLYPLFQDTYRALEPISPKWNEVKMRAL